MVSCLAYPVPNATGRPPRFSVKLDQFMTGDTILTFFQIWPISKAAPPAGGVPTGHWCPDHPLWPRDKGSPASGGMMTGHGARVPRLRWGRDGDPDRGSVTRRSRCINGKVV